MLVFAAACPLVASALIACRSAPSSLPPEAAIAPDVRAQIEALNRAMEDRLVAQDPRGVAAFYADDAVLLAPGGRRVEGRDEIDAYWAGMGSRGGDFAWTLTADSIEGKPGDGGLIVQRGTSTLSRTTPTGDLRTSTVDFVLVWRHTPGGYRIAVDAYWPVP